MEKFFQPANSKQLNDYMAGDPDNELPDVHIEAPMHVNISGSCIATLVADVHNLEVHQALQDEYGALDRKKRQTTRDKARLELLATFDDLEGKMAAQDKRKPIGLDQVEKAARENSELKDKVWDKALQQQTKKIGSNKDSKFAKMYDRTVEAGKKVGRLSPDAEVTPPRPEKSASKTGRKK